MGVLGYEIIKRLDFNNCELFVVDESTTFTQAVSVLFTSYFSFCLLFLERFHPFHFSVAARSPQCGCSSCEAQFR
jgi:hypothetical protein